MEGKTNGLQIAGFVVSLVTCFIFGFYGISGVVGIVLSAIGRSKAKEVGGATGLGTAGIVLGIISAVGGLIGASTLLVCLANVKNNKVRAAPDTPRRQRRIFYSLFPFHPIPTPPLYFAEEDTETTFDFCLPPINYRIQNILLSPRQRNLPRCLQ